MAAVAEGDRYRNTSGVLLYGFFPPDAVCTVRNVDAHDDPSVGGSLVLEYDPDDDSGVRCAAGMTEDELDAHFERVDGSTAEEG